MTEWVVAILALAGIAFSFLGAVGVVRLPDVYMRMQAATKSGTLGVAFLTLATALRFDNLGDTTQAILIVAFLLLTMPVAGHIVGRAAYSAKVPMWGNSLVDELQEHRERDAEKLPALPENPGEQQPVND